jgi:hypothetical protein
MHLKLILVLARNGRIFLPIFDYNMLGLGGYIMLLGVGETATCLKI